MKNLWFILMCLYSFCGFSQRKDIDICQGRADKKMFDTGYVHVWYYGNIQDTVKKLISYKNISGVHYVSAPRIVIKNSIAIYSNLYLREDSTGSLMLYDTILKKESLYLPADETMLGQAFEIERFSGKELGKVFDYHFNLETPYCNYTDVIKLGLKVKNPPDVDYGFMYFKRGIGIVAQQQGYGLDVFIEAIYKENWKAKN